MSDFRKRSPGCLPGAHEPPHLCDLLFEGMMAAAGSVASSLPFQPTTWSSADKSSIFTLSNSDLTVTSTSSGGFGHARSVFGVSSGKWCVEFTITQTNTGVGISKLAANTGNWLGADAYGWNYYAPNGQRYNNASGTSGYATFGIGDIVAVILDADNGKLWWAKNGTVQGGGDPAAGTSPAYSGLMGPFFLAMDDGSTGGLGGATANFGGSAFTYAVPAGFTAGFGANGGLLTGGTNIGTYTGQGGLAAAFDGVRVTTVLSCAQTGASVSGYGNRLGKQWASPKTVTAFVVCGPSDDYFIGNATSNGLKLQGSNDGSTWVDLWTGVYPSTTYGVVAVCSGIDTSATYSYHCVNLVGNGTNSNKISELQFFGG